MKKLLLLVLSACISTSVYCGEITEIELPDLLGTYVWRDEKTATFQFDTIPQTIYEIQLRLIGVVDPGMQECEGGSVPINNSLGMKLRGVIPDTDTVPDAWWVFGHEVRPPQFDYSDIEFEITRTFSPQNNPSWDFLQGGSGQVILQTSERYDNDYLCIHIEDPSVVSHE